MFLKLDVPAGSDQTENEWKKAAEVQEGRDLTSEELMIKTKRLHEVQRNVKSVVSSLIS